MEQSTPGTRSDLQPHKPTRPAFAGWFVLLIQLLVVTGFSTSAASDSVKQAAIAIIIDDMGYNLNLGLRAVALPGPVTYAVLPYSPYSERLASVAHQQGKEVMLHMPMGNHDGRPLGPGGLTAELDRVQFQRQLFSALESVPYLQGINNHMGSSLTQNSKHMNWLMDSLKERTLYFVDSRTSADSVAGITARRKQIPSLDRDVFLDHDPAPESIDEQFKRLIDLARKRGSAVAIGHPYPSTLGYLENVIPKLGAMGIRLVSPSGLLLLKQASLTAPQQPPAEPMVTASKAKDNCVITEQIERRVVNCKATF